MRDLYSNIAARLALAPAVQAAAIDGSTIDTLGAGSVAFLVSTGAIVGAGAFGAVLYESSDGSTWTLVAAGEVQSDAPAALAQNASYRLGYVGNKRYVRLSLTKASGTSIAAGATAILSNLAKRPVA